jgi:hypothetical protein
VSLLKEATLDSRISNKEIDLKEEPDVYNVEVILDSRVSKNGKMKYLIKWLDWDNIHNTWELAQHLSCPKKVVEFYQRNPS